MSYPESQSRWLDSNQRSPRSERGGHSRLPHIALQSGSPDLNRHSPAPRAGGLTKFSQIPNKSTRRELNPHNGPGKAVRYRYVTGALSFGGRPRACGPPPNGWISSPRCQRANRTVGPEGLEPSRRWLRARNAAANTLVPSVGPEGVGPSPHRLKGEHAAITPRPRVDQGPTFVPGVPTHAAFPPVVRGGIAPASGGVSDRHAAVTSPDRQ